MLTLHRRHVKACEHLSKGWNYTLCDCPVWCDGTIDSQRVTRSLGTRSWERAAAKIAAMERGIDVGIELEKTRTVEQAAAAYLKGCVGRNLRASTIRSQTKALDYLKDSIGQRAIDGIRVTDLERHLDSRKAGTKPIGPRTRRKEIEYLRALFAWCIDRGWCADNPAKRIRPPRVETLATLPFTADEVRSLLDACGRLQSMWKEDRRYVRQRARALVLTLLYSGLRVGDVAQLRRAALESSGHLMLRVMKTGVPLKLLLHADAAAALRGLPAPGGNTTYFFWSGNGDVQDCAKSLWRTVSRAGKLAGVHAHPHRFRDTFAVELLTQGADIRTVQKLLGHESVQTTERHYAHFVAAHQKLLDEAAARLDFSPRTTGPVLVRPNKRRLRDAK